MTFTATVTVASPGSTAVAAPTGTVTFYDGGTAIGTGTLAVVNGADQASYTTSVLGTASHTITAAYTSGDGNFNASSASSPITQVVAKANTTTSVITSNNSIMSGQPVTFTATVTVASPGSTAVAYPTGTVTFYDGGTAIGTGTLAVSAGGDQASYTTSAGTASHTITAAYTSGDGNFNASPASSSITQVISPSIIAKYQFGTATSPVAPGYTLVTNTTKFSSALGYGWQSGTISSRDRGIGSIRIVPQLHHERNVRRESPQR